MKNPELYQNQDERISVPNEVDYDTLLSILVDAKIPVEEFGTGAAKTVDHLLKEIAEGESTLSIDTNGNLLRSLQVLWLDVLSVHANGDVYLLKEDKQVFIDGREKTRALPSSLGEKLKKDEDSEAAVPRALAEELGISEEGIEHVYTQGESEDMRIPDAYPGLESSYRYFKYTAVVSEEAFDSNGYIEYQDDKTNYYSWQLIHSNS